MKAAIPPRSSCPDPGFGRPLPVAGHTLLTSVHYRTWPQSVVGVERYRVVAEAEHFCFRVRAAKPPVHKTDGQSTKPKVTGSNPVGRAPLFAAFTCKRRQNTHRRRNRRGPPKSPFQGPTPGLTIAQLSRTSSMLKPDSGPLPRRTIAQQALRLSPSITEIV